MKRFALDAMLSERSITRAAQRVHLSQSAMSSALGRLRDYFGDTSDRVLRTRPDPATVSASPTAKNLHGL